MGKTTRKEKDTNAIRFFTKINNVIHTYTHMTDTLLFQLKVQLVDVLTNSGPVSDYDSAYIMVDTLRNLNGEPPTEAGETADYSMELARKSKDLVVVGRYCVIGKFTKPIHVNVLFLFSIGFD